MHYELICVFTQYIYVCICVYLYILYVYVDDIAPVNTSMLLTIVIISLGTTDAQHFEISQIITNLLKRWLRH